MGEREITEHVEVSEQEEVHLCDFCARSSEEFDGTFNDIYINPSVEIVNEWIMSHRSDNGDIVASGSLVDPNYVKLNCDNRMHFCDECNRAHIEVHNDDS